MADSIRFTAGGERAIVSFVGAGLAKGQFNVYLPVGGVPGNVAKVLAAVAPRLRNEKYDPGQMAADFIASTKPAVRCQLVDSARVVTDFYGKTDLRVIVTPGPILGGSGYNVAVHTVRDGRESPEALFSGAQAQFAAWAEAQTGLEAVVGKVVAFKYDGGTNRGAERLVRVEKVERAGGEVHVCGYDLRKPDLKHAFRRYSAGRILGEIRLVA